MKNMSFGKMLGLFGGFLLLMIVCAFVIIKMSASGGAKQEAVTTKRYNAPAQAGAPRQQGAVTTTQAGYAPISGATGSVVSPAPAQLAVGQGAPAADVRTVVIPATPGAINDVNQNQNIANVSAAVINLDARVALLESNRAGVERTVATQAAPVKRARRTRPAVKVVVVREAPPLTEMRGYKAMAVVGGRAWVSAPDGYEDSVVVGEAIPRARVRSMSKDTGMVITTNDQRIDAVN